MLSKNEIIEMTIESITNEGMGIGHYKSMAVFVPHSVRLDKLNVKIVKVLSKYAYGIIDKIIAPSPYRIESTCPISSKCGGCALREMAYEEECRQKEQWVYDAFERIGGIVPKEKNAIIPSPKEDAYRNKAQYPIGLADGKVIAGFYAPRSHRIIPVENCNLQPLEFSKIVKAFCLFLEKNHIMPYDEETGEGLVRHLYLRSGEISDEIMVCIVAQNKDFPYKKELIDALVEASPKISAIILNVNEKNTNVILGNLEFTLYGKNKIDDKLAGVQLELSAKSFYQVNHDGAEKLYNQAKIAADLNLNDVLLDLYCGTGTIGLSMAENVQKLIGVEIVPEAVEDAKENAKLNHVKNATFICADAAKAAKELAEQGTKPSVVLVDPPRKGCDQQTLHSILDMNPERIVMVSCNPSTAARDCKELIKNGYCVKKIQPVDMFPRTAHVETVVLLFRK